MIRFLASLLPTAAFVLAAAPATSGGAQEPRTIARLDFPAGIAFAADGTMFVTERAGRIRVVDGGELEERPLATIPTTTEGETGLLGIAVSPDGRYLYAFATDPGGQTNRVWRVPLDGGSPQVVVDDLPAGLYHNGGGVAFDRDGMLLVSNGEQHDEGRAQEPGVLGGKVYRFTPEGDVPPDNPFGEAPALAIGLRNPYGLTVDPASGAIYVTENGPSAWDEINRIEPRGNYGWPDVLGPAGGERPAGPGDYHDPIAAYERIIVPTGIAIADPRSARAEYRGDIFFGAFAEGTVRRVQLDDAGRVASDEVFVEAGDGVVAVAWGPQGLYYSTTRAVHVIPLAKERGASPAPSPSPAAEPSPPPATEDERAPSPLGYLVYAAAASLVVAGLGFLLYRWRRAERVRSR